MSWSISFSSMNIGALLLLLGAGGDVQVSLTPRARTCWNWARHKNAASDTPANDPDSWLRGVTPTNQMPQSSQEAQPRPTMLKSRFG